MSNKDNWEVAPAGTLKRLEELEAKLEEVFIAGWAARDSIEPLRNMKAYQDHGGHDWYNAFKETKH